MVYCNRCGAENDEEADVCVKCGASLGATVHRVRRRDYKSDMCFGRRGGTPLLGLLFGLMILLWGLSSLMGGMFRWMRVYNLWPILIIVLGLMILWDNLSNR
jgi:ribosomal protein L40E